MPKFRMPADWEPHYRCWIGCPECGDNWRDDAVHAQLVFVRVSSEISRFEPGQRFFRCLWDQWENARSQLPEHIRFVELRTNDSWLRDT